MNVNKYISNVPFYPNGIGGGGGGGGGSSSSFKLVTVATTTNINLASAPSSIDGYSSLVSGTSIVLVKNQTPDTGGGNPADGLYVWNGATNPMTRLTGFTTWESFVGLLVGVIFGNTNNSTLWASNAQTGGTLGTTNLLFIDMSGATLLPANYAQVATNGIDGTLINSTINGALSGLPTNSVIELYPNLGTSVGYDMPTSSLNNQAIIGIYDTSPGVINYCDILATNNTLPITNGDIFSITNVALFGTSGNPTPIVINNITGVSISFQNVQFIPSGATDGLTMNGSCSGNYYFTDCTVSITLRGTPSGSGVNIYLDNCDAAVYNLAGSGALYNIYTTDCRLAINTTSGTFIGNNITFTADCLINADFIQIIGGTTYKELTFGSSYQLSIASTGIALLSNVSTDHTNNVYNNAGTLVIGTNNKNIQLASGSTYNLTFSDKNITANCASSGITINLPPLNGVLTFGSNVLFVEYKFYKKDSTTNAVTLVANGTDVIWQTGSPSGMAAFTGFKSWTLATRLDGTSYVWTIL